LRVYFFGKIKYNVVNKGYFNQRKITYREGLIMNIILRVLLAIYAFCLLLLSALLMCMTVRPGLYFYISERVQETIFAEGNTGARIAVFVISVVFFILSLTFLLSGIKSNKDKRAVSKHTNIGEISISLNSIANIAQNVAKKVTGVKDSKTYVKKHEDGVFIEIRIVVMPELSIPAISEEVQERVKKSVEDSAGVVVKHVKVTVENIYTGITYKPRVE